MIRFGWLSIVLLIGAVQGAVVAGLLLGRATNRTANRLLGAFLLAFVLQIVPYIIGFAGFYMAYPWLSFAPFSITLVYGPLLYLYVARITADGLPARWWVHLIPGALQATYYLVVFAHPLPFKNDWDLRIQEPFVDPVESLLTFLSLGGYLVAAILRYRRYERWLRDETSDPDLYSLSWVRTFLVLFTATVVLDAGFETYSRFVQHLTYLRFFWLYAWYAALAYYLALEGWRNAGRAYPQPLIVAPAAAPPPEIRKPAFDLAAAAEEFRERLIASDHWRDPGLTLPLLAERMAISPTQISRFVNDGLGQNFTETVNRIRVQAVQERLRDPAETRDILTLALDAGFNSKASFNRCFRAFTETTPTEFRNSVTRRLQPE